MREDGVNRIRAKTTKIVLDKDNVKKEFVRLDNRRDVRQSQVNRLYRVLEAGDHFETPLMTHYKNKVHRLLDGNHRHEAIMKYLLKHPDRKVEAWIFFYENLTEQQEKDYYTKWNSGIKQTTNDFVKQYWNDIPLTRMIKNNSFPYPISPSWTSNSMELKLLIGGYLMRNSPFGGGFGGSALDFIDAAKKLNNEDYIKIKAFFKEFIEIYGMPDKKNPHYNLNAFNSIFRIWMDNVKRVDYPTMNKNLIKIRNCERIIYFEKLSGSRSNSVELRLALLNIINSRYKFPRFI